MNYENMSLDELKEYAKQLDMIAVATSLALW